MTRAEAEAIIRNYQHRAPVDVMAIARDLGISVWTSFDLPHGVSGKLFRDPRHGGQSGYSIVVNSSDAPVRQRFTAAHEIAHFILHRDQFGSELVDDAMYRSGLSNAQEAQANRMAADILMPVPLMSELAKNGICSSERLAHVLQVSNQAIKIRLGIE